MAEADQEEDRNEKEMTIMPGVPNMEIIMVGLREELPVNILDILDLKNKNVGLVIVDEVNGFCKPGAGNLAPVAPDAVIESMINRTDTLAQIFTTSGRPVLIFRDTHDPNRPEPPYPPHCNKGTGEEELVDQLKWLVAPGSEGLSSVTVIEKDCINGYIGGLSGVADLVKDWVDFENINVMVVVGICTDICDLQFVQSVLSARNHGLLEYLEEVVVVVPACATYDLPLSVTRAIGLPDTAAHPRGITQHMGLYLMQSSGAILTNEIILD